MLSFQPPLNNQKQRPTKDGNHSQNNNNSTANNNFRMNTQGKPFGSNFSKNNVFQKKSSTPKGPSKGFPGSRNVGARNQSNNSRSFSALTQDDLNFDNSIGSFHTNQNSFQTFTHEQRPISKFLIYQSPTLKGSPIHQDDWDKANQQKMSQLEQGTSDVSSLFEDFQKLRENERKVMEEKGLVDKEDTRKTLEDAISFQGSCLEMCPVYERIRRSVENDVRKYERDSTGKISKGRAIKAFSRPAAGQPPPLPSDVRPPQVLNNTLNYIVENVLQELPDAQSFIWDRTRSIRQDFTYQNYFGPEAVDCNERIVRIHILTLHTMAKTRTEYSQQQELEQMNKSLKTLSEMYSEYRSRGLQAPNEAEFRAYYLISQLRDPELDREIQSFPKNIIQDERVQLALNLRNLVQTNIIERGFQPTENVLNLYQNFFQNFSQGHIPILISYLLEIHLNEIRFYAIKSLKRSLHTKSKPYEADYMIKLLSFNDLSDLSDFLDYYGITFSQNNGRGSVDILSLNHSSHLIADQKPLRQAHFDKYDSQISSFKQLIDSGVSNVGVLNIPATESSLNIPTPQVSNDTIQAQSKAPPNFSFSFPQAASTPEVSQINIEEQKKLEKQNLLKKKIEEERIKKEQKELEEQRKREQEIKRLQELEAKRIKFEEEAKVKKSELLSEVGLQLMNEITQNVVREEVSNIVNPLIKSHLAKKQKKEVILNSFSQGLFEAFVGELVYFESLKLLADNFRKNSLKKLIINKVSGIAKESKEKIDVKKRKREEFLEASKNFGIPKVILKRKKLNNISTSTISQKQNEIDLTPLKFDELFENLKTSIVDKYEILFFSENQNSTRSKFLNKKLSIDNNKLSEKIIRNKDSIELKIISTNEINPKIFNNINLLIFNCDGIDNIREQKLLLKELINGISLNSNYKFEVLIIFWELKGLIKLSKNEILKELNFKMNDVILDVEVLKIDGDLKIEPLQEMVNKLGKKSGFTARGEYNLRFNDRKKFVKKDEVVKSNNVINKNLVKDVDNKFYKHLQKHIEASPKRSPLPKLLSNSNKFLNINDSKKLKIEVYSTPRPKSSELLQTPSFYNDSTGSSISNLSNITFANQSISTPIINKPSYAQVVKNSLKEEESKIEENIPKSILELRKLAASVRERHGKKN